MNQPKVSVIVPVYNVEEYLEECLDSVTNQTLKSIEILCVDDGSTDGSAKILQEYEEKDNRVVVITQENGGLSAARNTGLAAARGAYVYFLDSDDYILPQTLEKLYELSETERLDVLFFGAESFFENQQMMQEHGTYLHYYHRKRLAAAPVSGSEMLERFAKKGLYRSSVPLQFFRRAFLLETGILFPVGVVHEDELFTPLVLLRAERTLCIEDNFYMRRVRGNSLVTRIVTTKKFDGQFSVFSSLLAHCILREQAGQRGDYGLFSRVESMLAATRATYKALSPREREAVLSCAGEGQAFLFRHLNYPLLLPLESTAEAGESAKESGGEDLAAAALKSRVQTLSRELSLVHSSASYRIGRFLTFLPRKLRGGVRCYREHGLQYTVIRLLEHLHLWNWVCRWSGKKSRPGKKSRSATVVKGTTVSVILPVYNVEPYLPQCLESLMAQTLKNIEILCVDDGSTDASAAIAEDYARKDPRIRVLRQQNRFAGVARNNGMSCARGKYLLFLDADDFFEPDLLEKMVSRAEEDDAEICLCAADRYGNDTGKYEPAGWLLSTRFLPKKRPFSRRDDPRHIFQITSPAPWNKLFLAEFVHKHALQFQPLQRSNDVYFTFAALALAEKITATEDVLVHYRVGLPGNLQSGNSKTPTIFLEALEALQEKLRAEQLWEEVRGSFSDFALNTTVYQYKSLTETAGETLLCALRARYARQFELLAHPQSFYSLEENYALLQQLLTRETDSLQEN